MRSPTARRGPILSVAGVGLLVAGAAGYSLVTGARMAERHAPLADAAMEIKLEAAIGHLWFEEGLAEGKSEDVVTALEHLDLSAWYGGAMLEGGENPEGVFVPVRDPMLRRRIQNVLIRIGEIRAAAEARWATAEDSGIGSPMDQDFNTLFWDLLDQADGVEIALRGAMARDLRRFRAVQGVLLALCLGLSALVGIVWQRYERRQALDARAIEQSEELYRSVAEDTPVALCRFLLSGEITYVNEAYRRYSQRTTEELIGGTFCPPATEADQETLMADLSALTVETPTLSHERQAIAPDGEVRWQRWTTRAIFDAQGQAASYAAAGEDITERKRADRRLRLLVEGTAAVTGEDFFAQLVRHLAAATEVSIAFVAELMSARPKKTGRTLGVWIENESGQNFEWELAHTPCERVVDGRTICFRKGVQSTFPDDEWLEEVGAESYLGVPMTDPSGRVIGHMGLIDKKPLRERQGNEHLLRIFAARAGAELERQRADVERRRLMLGIEQTSDKVLITDINGTIQYVNPAFASGTGYAVHEAVGKNPRMLKSGRQDDAFYESMWETLSRGDPWSGRIINKKKDGTLYTDEETISPMRDASGRTVNYVAVMRDVSEDRRREDLRRRAQNVASIGRLAGGVAHDLNNLLLPILGYGELLLESLGAEDSRRAAVGQIMHAGTRARDLVGQLLAFGRKQTLQCAPVDVNRVVASCEAVLRRTMREDIAVKIVASPDLGSVMADSGQLARIVTNLAANAQDAMPEGGQLTLETSLVDLDAAYVTRHQAVEAGAHVMLAVSDTGCGMDDETRKCLYDPFFSTKDELGAGLGLAAVYGIVKQHGGHIDVHSELGEGTTFKVYLPVFEQEPLEERTGGQRASGTRDASTVLLVEDHEQVRRLAKLLLEREGYTVLEAAGGPEAVAILASHDGPVDLLLTDVIMPGMSGTELFAKVAGEHTNLRVLYMSGYTNDMISDQGVMPKGAAFIQKPFTVQAMATKVREVLKQERD